MKSPKNEPYQRSRHRAALQAWVVAATAVAAIGLPQVSSPAARERASQPAQDNSHDAMHGAQQVAAFWIDSLLAADSDDALSLMRLPVTSENQKQVKDDLAHLSDLLAQEGVRVEPVAHHQCGHWALSAWEMIVPDVSLAPVVEPITLYNASVDGMFDACTDWQVVPPGVSQDPALKPLYNADYAALQAWFETLL